MDHIGIDVHKKDSSGIGSSGSGIGSSGSSGGQRLRMGDYVMGMGPRTDRPPPERVHVAATADPGGKTLGRGAVCRLVRILCAHRLPVVLPGSTVRRVIESAR
jgi:hypothetical protein